MLLTCSCTIVIIRIVSYASGHPSEEWEEWEREESLEDL